MKKLKFIILLILPSLQSCWNNVDNYYVSNNLGDTIYYQNFEECENGKQSVSQIKESWINQSYLWGIKDRIFFYLGINGQSPEIVNQNNKFLKITIPKNTAGPIPGCQWTSKFDQKFEYLTLEYRVKFDSCFNFIKGGKLPGLAGGHANTGGIKPNGKDGWSARMMFWEGGKLCFWIYHKDQPGKFGDSIFFKRNGEYFTFERGKWYSISHHIHMNSIGKKDGTVDGYVDGELMATKDKLEFRTINNLSIDQLVFSVFLGGEGKEYESQKEEKIYLDDFIVRKHAIPLE